MSWMFANGLGDQGWILDRKMVLDAALLRTQTRIKSKGNGVASSPTPRCSSYWKGSLRVTLDWGRQFELLSVKEDI